MPVWRSQLVQSGCAACQGVYLSGRPYRSLRLWLCSRDEGRHRWHWAVQLPRFRVLNQLFFFFLFDARLKGSVDQTDNKHSVWLILLFFFSFSQPQWYTAATSWRDDVTLEKDTVLLSHHSLWQNRHDAERGGGGRDWKEGEGVAGTDKTPASCFWPEGHHQWCNLKVTLISLSKR